MRKTLKVLSLLLSYPTAELQAALPQLRQALDQEACLSPKDRNHLDGMLQDLADGDLFDLQERYVLLFDRTRSLSLHLFEHVHGESRDRGQAMVDLKALYERHGLAMISRELPDHLPLFLEFLSEISASEARELIQETSGVLEAIRLRLQKRKAAYASVFSCLQALATAKAPASVVAALLQEGEEDPNDLVALDAAWQEEEVLFGPAAAAASQCGKDGIAAKLRAARRPAPDLPATSPKRPIVTYSQNHRP
jgi:nitrate reductase delta subunit